MQSLARAAVVLLCGVAIPLAAQATPEQAHAVETAAVLASAWNPATGLFQGTGWWNSANGITVLLNLDREVPGAGHTDLVSKTFELAQHKFPGFLNEYYDDEGWWALAWLDAYQLHADPQTLRMAAAIFKDMSGGWSESCGGGIWWKKNEHYKNAIANELFLSVATGLAETSKGKAKRGYLKWAKKEAAWFAGSGMINADSLVNDGLDSSCHNNGRTTWSYNQGVLLTGLAQLSALSGDQKWMEMAHRVADATLTHLVDSNGVLHDSCEPKCGDDGVQFKGIFVRNLFTLNELSPNPAYSRFLQTNATSVWTKARTSDGHFAVNWAGPAEDSGTGSLISALDALVAGASVAKVTGPAAAGAAASAP